MAVEWKALLNYLLIIYVFVFFLKCGAVSASNNRCLVHTLWNVTDIFCVLCIGLVW